jgi:hypothetical protein
MTPHEEELYRRVDEVLHYIWDPIRVSGIPPARDEYESYVPDVFMLLKENAGADRIASYLLEVTTDRMGLRANPERALNVAELLLAWKDRLLSG